VAWALILPSLVVILGVVLYPLIETFFISFYDSSLTAPDAREFVGLGNYIGFMRDGAFWETIGRTTYFTVISVGAEIVLGIGIALLINAHEFGWRFLRISLIIPWAVPTIVNGTIWRWIYNADYGALNGLLYQLGVIEKYVPWLIQPWRAMNLVIVADVWHSVPFVALIIQAALATHPAELHEAAAIDGATAWQRFWRITMPLLRPALLVVLVVRTVEAFRVFDIIYIITRSGPAAGTMTISYLSYLETFSYLHVGSGAALSFIVSAFVLVAALVYMRLLSSPDLAE